MEKTHKLIFITILFLAIFLRLYQLDIIPPGVNRDEASIGYTAYSLLHTGKDEYGRAYPLSFQSFGDWKLPLYIYTTVGTVWLFGLNEFAVRIPSATFGMLTVVLTYFLAFELFQNRRLALLSMLLIAIAPWHLHLSRVESESNTAVFLVTAAVLLFLKSRKHASFLLIPSLALLALTYFTYAGNYIFTTLLLIGLFLIFYKTIPKTRYLVVAVVVFILLFGFVAIQTMFGNQTKFSGIGIFGDPAVVHAEIELPRNKYKDPNGIIPRLLHNRLTYSMKRFGQNYAAAFSPEFLFVRGGENKAHNIEGFGNMYLVEAIFVFAGLLFLIIKKSGNEKKLILFWFFMAPIAASLTKDAPHTNRMFAIFPILPIVVAVGLYWTVESIQKPIARKIAIVAIFMLFIANMAIYLDRYYIHFPRNEAENWGIGFKKLNNELEREDAKHKKVIMTKPETSPYIFLAFYSRFDPRAYQESAVRYPPTEDGFVHVSGFDRFAFREIDWESDIKESDVLLVAKPSEVADFVKSGSFQKVDITLPSGEIMFTIVK